MQNYALQNFFEWCSTIPFPSTSIEEKYQMYVMLKAVGLGNFSQMPRYLHPSYNSKFVKIIASSGPLDDRTAANCDDCHTRI